MALPDLIEVVPPEHPAPVLVTIPGSKSLTNRALVLAALADGETTLRGALWSEDTEIMVDALGRLGFNVSVETDASEEGNRTIRLVGQGGRLPNAGTQSAPLEIYVGNAGTVARFLMAMLCLGDGVYRKPSLTRIARQGAVYTVAGNSGQITGGSLDHPAMFVSLNVLGSMVLDVSGMSCAGCVSRVESALRAVPGVREASVNLALGRAEVAVTRDGLEPDLESAVAEGATILRIGTAVFGPRPAPR